MEMMEERQSNCQHPAGGGDAGIGHVQHGAGK